MKQTGALIKCHQQSFGQRTSALSFKITSPQHTQKKVNRRKWEQLS